jgi:hypothetical protein
MAKHMICLSSTFASSVIVLTATSGAVLYMPLEITTLFYRSAWFDQNHYSRWNRIKRNKTHKSRMAINPFSSLSFVCCDCAHRFYTPKVVFCIHDFDIGLGFYAQTSIDPDIKLCEVLLVGAFDVPGSCYSPSHGSASASMFP